MDAELGVEKGSSGERELGELNDLLNLLEVWKPNTNGCGKAKWFLFSDGNFSVKQLKAMIEDKLEATTGRGLATRWSKIIPKKIAILIWRARIRRFPTQEVLHKMGIDLDSILCP